MSEEKLFAVYLGGRAPKAVTELHDVVFATGKIIEDTYEQLMDKWFGTPKGLHLNSWMELDIVDGYRITLTPTKIESGKKLFFVNLGAYKEGEFTEIHAIKMLVEDSWQTAKVRAKKDLLKGWSSPVHTDDLYEVDSCIEIDTVGGFHIVLTKTDEKENLKPVNGYHLIPKGLVEDYMQRHSLVDAEEPFKGFRG